MPWRELSHRGPDDLFECVERIPRDICVRLMVYQAAAGDTCMFPTKVGIAFGDLGRDGDNEMGFRVIEAAPRICFDMTVEEVEVEVIEQKGGGQEYG